MEEEEQTDYLCWRQNKKSKRKSKKLNVNNAYDNYVDDEMDFNFGQEETTTTIKMDYLIGAKLSVSRHCVNDQKDKKFAKKSLFPGSSHSVEDMMISIKL